MKLRDALIEQSPSLELQRAAANEIARLDAELARLSARVNMRSWRAMYEQGPDDDDETS